MYSDAIGLLGANLQYWDDHQSCGRKKVPSRAEQLALEHLVDVEVGHKHACPQRTAVSCSFHRKTQKSLSESSPSSFTVIQRGCVWGLTLV